MIPDLRTDFNLIIFESVILGWFALFALLILYLYLKAIKPYRVSQKIDYFTQKPSELNIIEVSNLVNRKLNANVLAAYVLNLINRNVLKLEVIDDKEYIVKNGYPSGLSISDEATLNLILNIMGDGNRVTIEQLRNFCKRKKNKNILLNEWQLWCRVMRKENFKHIFYETKDEYGLVKFMTVLGCAIFFANIIGGFNKMLGYFTMVPALFLLLSFTRIYKRTRQANEEFHLWIAFKSYLDNITSFEEPITNPEEMLMYGTCLGVRGLEKKITNHDYCERLIEALNVAVIKAILSGNRSIF